MSRPMFKHDRYYLTLNEQKKKKKEAEEKELQRKQSAHPLRQKQIDPSIMKNIDNALAITLCSSQPKQQECLLKQEQVMSIPKKAQTMPKNIFASGYKTMTTLLPKENDQIMTQRQKEKEQAQFKQQLAKLNKSQRTKKLVEESASLVDDAEQKVSENKPIRRHQKNYFKLDLKRRYQDRYLGEKYNNLRKYQRNGKLRPKFRMQSELVVEDGEVYNSYISSLSKAFYLDLNIGDSEDGEQPSVLSAELAKEYQIPSQITRESLTKLLNDTFGHQSFREGQYQTICNILNQQSTIFVSETASGKSMTYILSSLILGNLSVIVSPLVSLMLDQLQHLPQGMHAACISGLINRQQRDRILKMVKDGTIQLLYLTPQSLQTDLIYHVKEFPPINFLCIDEAHSLSELSHNFRTSYLALTEIVLHSFKYINDKPTLLCLTATANPATVQSIQQKLHIDSVIRSNHLMNKNLFVTVSRQGGQLKYESLIKYLNHPQIVKCKGILVYVRTRKIMYEVYNYITNSGMSASVYHSALSNKEKTETLSKFREGKIKTVIATTSLGMGLDFEHLQCIVHVNVPKSIQNYVQQIGRAGRRQVRAYCHLFLDKGDYLVERNYIIADELEEETMKLILSQLELGSSSHVNALERKACERIVRLQQTGKVCKRKQPKILSQPSEKIPKADIYEQADSQQQDVQDKQSEQHRAVSADNQLQLSPQNIFYQQCSSDVANTVSIVNETRLFYQRVSTLTECSQLREESLLTLLLKIESMYVQQPYRIKILPLSYQQIKIGFFRANQKQLVENSTFFCTIIRNCKRIKGTIFVNLIDKCNELKMKPIQFMSNLHKLGDEYMLKIQHETDIFVWRFISTQSTGPESDASIVSKSLQLLNNSTQIQCIIQQMNSVQNTAVTKLNILYSLAFTYSRSHMNHIIEKNKILNANQPIPADIIVSQFDRYFHSNLDSFYSELTDSGNDNFLPTETIGDEQLETIYASIEMFFRHQLSNLHDDGHGVTNEQCRQIVQMYRDGKIITKVFMGINNEQVNWKIYGDHTYWMQFKKKNYGQLLTVVRNLVERYAQEKGYVNKERKYEVIG